MPSVRASESRKAYWAFAALGPFAIYGVVLALLGVPFIQKESVYSMCSWCHAGTPDSPPADPEGWYCC